MWDQVSTLSIEHASMKRTSIRCAGHVQVLAHMAAQKQAQANAGGGMLTRINPFKAGRPSTGSRPGSAADFAEEDLMDSDHDANGYN